MKQATVFVTVLNGIQIVSKAYTLSSGMHIHLHPASEISETNTVK